MGGGLGLGARQWRHVQRPLWLALVALIAALVALLSLALLPGLMGYSTFAVYGGSMAPAIAKGSVAFVRPVAPDTLREGDVIVYSPSTDSGLPVLHRIVRVRELDGRQLFTLKGDANETVDPNEVELTGRGGVAVLTLPWAGYLLAFAQSALVKAAALCIFVVVILALALKKIWLPQKRTAARA